jgi:protein disulfide-isomerase-like protein
MTPRASFAAHLLQRHPRPATPPHSPWPPCAKKGIILTSPLFSPPPSLFPSLFPAPLPAQWCGHCKRLAPTWEKLADEVSSAGLNKVHIASVDCTVSRDVCSAQGIRGYPTLQLFKNGGEPIKYNGGRDLSALLDFAKQHSA